MWLMRRLSIVDDEDAVLEANLGIVARLEHILGVMNGMSWRSDLIP